MITDTPEKQVSEDENKASELKSTVPSGSQKKGVATPETDSAALYRRAQELSRKVLQEPDVDNEKVSVIKAAIENGTYEVDAESIAEKLIADVDILEIQPNSDD